jgi:hypothetical protein
MNFWHEVCDKSKAENLFNFIMRASVHHSSLGATNMFQWTSHYPQDGKHVYIAWIWTKLNQEKYFISMIIWMVNSTRTRVQSIVIRDWLSLVLQFVSYFLFAYHYIIPCLDRTYSDSACWFFRNHNSHPILGNVICEKLNCGWECEIKLYDGNSAGNKTLERTAEDLGCAPLKTFTWNCSELCTGLNKHEWWLLSLQICSVTGLKAHS